MKYRSAVSVTRLDNDRWGFGSSCFVCEPRNEAGLGIPFDHDDEANEVRATFTLDARFSGAPSYLHGGISLAVLDEAMAWAAIAVAGKFAVTAESTTRFVHPIRVDREYTAVGRIESISNEKLEASASILDSKGRPCATATGLFVVLSAAQAVDAVGAELSESEVTYTRE